MGGAAINGAEFGELARTLGVRLSTHPGQYTVLNSEREQVVASASPELEVQGALFEAEARREAPPSEEGAK